MLEGEGHKVIDVADGGPWDAIDASPARDPSLITAGFSSFAPLAFRLLVDPPAAGPWNMAVDETILEAADQGECTLRFYQWERPTLSLGYFQSYEDRWQHESSRECVAVRRSSGGGAILHDNEVTYSLATTANHPLAANRLGMYRAVHAALIDALTDWGIHATLCSPEPDASKAASKTKEPFLCFQRRAPGDVLLSSDKIAGSAQRRYRGAVLQHGSVLLGRSSAAPELPGIEEITGKRLEKGALIEAWLDRLFGSLSDDRPTERLPSEQYTRAMGLTHTKYGGATWTEHRGRL